MSVDLPEDKAREAVVDVLKHLNCTIRELRRLFLVEDLVDSIKVLLVRCKECSSFMFIVVTNLWSI